MQNERLAALTNAYENRLYGPDFETRIEDIASWLASPMFFWSVCSEKAIPTRPEDILGSLSILAVPERDAEALLGGQIRESDLRPWDPRSGERPALYFCSYSVSVAGAGRQQFHFAREYFEKMACFNRLPPVMAFSIAATDGGAAHLEQSGFVAECGSYLGKYAFYRAMHNSDRRLARIWASMLQRESTYPPIPDQASRELVAS